MRTVKREGDRFLITKTTSYSKSDFPPKLIDDLKQFRGVHPYDGFNPNRGDGYFINAIQREFGQDLVEAAIVLVIEPMEQAIRDATTRALAELDNLNRSFG